MANILVIILGESFTIIKNEMTDQMRHQAEGIINDASGYDTVPNLLVTEFDKTYGPKWLSIAGPKGIVTQFQAEPNTTLWLSNKSFDMILFKAVQPNYTEIISEARLLQPVLHYKTQTISDDMKVNIFELTKEVIIKNDNYNGILQALKKILTEKFGGQWITIVGQQNDYNIKWGYGWDISTKLYMDYHFGSLFVVVGQQI